MSYTPEQLFPLANAVSQVVLGVIGVDGSGPISGAREIKAAMDFIREAPERFQDNTLVQALVAALNRDDENNPLNSFLALDDMNQDVLLYNLNMALNAVSASDELPGTKEFIYDLAARVAEAAGSGLFGMGPKVSDEEQMLLTNLRATLGF
jgi:hypothetical protein